MSLTKTKGTEASNGEYAPALRSIDPKDSKSETDACSNIISYSKISTIRAVFDEYYIVLCDYAAGMIDDVHSAKDIVTQAFVEIMEQADQIKFDNQIKAWLYAKVDFTCREHKRRKRMLEQKMAEFKDISFTSEHIEIEKELREILINEIMNLPPQRRRILVKLFWQGLTYRQVAEKMKLSRQTVLNQKNKALQALRKTLGNKSILMAFNDHFTKHH